MKTFKGNSANKQKSAARSSWFAPYAYAALMRGAAKREAAKKEREKK